MQRSVINNFYCQNTNIFRECYACSNHEPSSLTTNRNIESLRRNKNRVITNSNKYRKHHHPYLKHKQMLTKTFCQAIYENNNNVNNINNNKVLFNCPMCRNVLKSPVTVGCGHTYCSDCLRVVTKCMECAVDLGDATSRLGYSVNVLVQDLVEKWRERNKHNKDPLPNTVDIFGLEPRYHLRSGYAGLKIHRNEEFRIANHHGYSTNCYDSFNHGTKNTHLTCTNSNLVIFNKCHTAFLRDCAFKDNLEHFHLMLKHVLKEVDVINVKALKSSWSCITPLDLECILCSRCLFDPVTTDCGHTFCRECLTRVLDHRMACPLCMTAMPVSTYSKGRTAILDDAIRLLAHREYEERLSIMWKENVISEDDSDIPVFVCTNAFPGVACPLYVSEPRYRLLTRRCLKAPVKRFAMTWNRFVDFGTVLEVRNAVSLEDGRYILSTVGVRRYRVINRSEQDGYDTAKVQYIRDNMVAIEKLPELIALHQKVYTKASNWIKCLSAKDTGEVERLIGKMPQVEKDWYQLPDGPSWTWWLMPIILPPCSQLQVSFLSTNSLEKRLRAIDKMFEHMKNKMKALHKENVSCNEYELNSDTCEDTDRELQFEANN